MRKLFLLTFIIGSSSCFAQNDPQKIIDEFFSRYKSKSPIDAVDYIFSTNKWMTESKDQIENIKFKLGSTLKLLGSYYGQNQITKKTLGEHLTLYTFLVRYDRQPLRFNFLFYKANDQWVILNFSYDDSIDEELKEATKAYRLKENADY